MISSIKFDTLNGSIVVTHDDATTTTYAPSDAAQYAIDTGRTGDFDAMTASWVPTLAARIASAVHATYADVDSIYALAVGNRAEEYRQAEIDALAYQAAGYTGTVSEYISAWAAANPPMTNTQSADAIIARATALRAAMLSARSQRFASQAAMRAATTWAELDAAVATWAAFVTATKAALA